MLFICIIYIYVTRHYIIYNVWIHGYKIAIPLGAAVPTNSQVLEVLEVGRVDTATGLSRLQCRAIIDQKDDTAAIHGDLVAFTQPTIIRQREWGKKWDTTRSCCYDCSVLFHRVYSISFRVYV